jgi:hypothetical protein
MAIQEAKKTVTNDQLKLSFTGKSKSHLFIKSITQRTLPVWFNGQRTYVDGI